MRQLFLLLVGIFLSAPTLAAPLNRGGRSGFYSPTGIEAVLQFQFSVEMVAFAQPSENEAKIQIEKQVAYLFGSFGNQASKSVPKGDHQFKILKAFNKGQNRWQVDYQYQGVIQTEVRSNSIFFDLPVNPDEIFQKSIVNSPRAANYPCGDDTHPQAEYFWYFFNPHAYGCPLKENVDYVRGQGSLKPLPSTKVSYPEYQRLVQNGVVEVHILFGMDNSMLSRNPMNSKDLNSSAYRAFHNYLLQNGYQAHLWSHDEMAQFFAGQTLDFPYVEDFTKAAAGGLVMKVRLFYGPSSTFDGFAFHRFWQDALANSSVAIYAGHSGLGEYLDPQRIEGMSGVRLAMPLNRYQVLFFNGCSSYPYYNKNYFAMKRSAQDPQGTKNLDIITNGLATLFMAITPSTSAILNAVESYVFLNKRISYQQMLMRADSQNLMGINGDEDNPL